MALPTYQLNSIPTTEEFNAFLRPKFNKNATEEEFPGNLKRLTDDALANEAGNIKPEWQAFRDEMKVTGVVGTTATYNGGVVEARKGRIFQVIAAGSVALQNNATNYIFVQNGAVSSNVTGFPLICLPMARVTLSGGAVSGTIVDQRPRFREAFRTDAIKVFGGSGDQGAYSQSGADSLTAGEYYFSSFNVANTGSVSITGAARIRASVGVTIAGSIIVAPSITGGRSFSINAGTTAVGASAGNGPGAGSGTTPGGGTYNYLLGFYGSGGAAGLITNCVGSPGVGGFGGGGLIVESAGDIVISGTITALGGTGGAGTLTSGTGSISGSGGGSGGLILLSSLTKISLTSTSLLDVSGGNGGAAAAGNAIGGGGGGGGQVVLIAPIIELNGSIVKNGGAAGANIGTSGTGGASGGGFGGSGGAGSTGQAGSAGILVLRYFLPVG